MSLRVLIADDHAILRNGLRSLLEREEGLTVVAEAEDGRQACELAAEARPHVVIMDIQMPGLNGLEATRKLLKITPQVKVLVLSMYTTRRFVVRALEAGARGYVAKECAFDEIVQAVQTVSRGGIYLSPQVAAPLEEDLRRLDAVQPSPLAVLSPREREVLQLLAEGFSTRAMGAELGISIKTAETHRHNVMKKLDLHTVAELTKLAIREGLTTLDS
jgi:DNA-binding NarL/FixJ family response regulator